MQSILAASSTIDDFSETPASGTPSSPAQSDTSHGSPKPQDSTGAGDDSSNEALVVDCDSPSGGGGGGGNGGGSSTPGKWTLSNYLKKTLTWRPEHKYLDSYIHKEYSHTQKKPTIIYLPS